MFYFLGNIGGRLEHGKHKKLDIPWEAKFIQKSMFTGKMLDWKRCDLLLLIAGKVGKKCILFACAYVFKKLRRNKSCMKAAACSYILVKNYWLCVLYGDTDR